MKKNFLNRRFEINPHQWPIILICIIPLLMICVLLTLVMYFFFHEFENFIVYGDLMSIPDFLQKWLITIIGGIWAFVILNIVIAYCVSSNLVGPFNRVIRELDAFLKENKIAGIHGRKSDTLANELGQRINQLIEKIPRSDLK